jgi:prenyltransferase beta subunit
MNEDPSTPTSGALRDIATRAAGYLRARESPDGGFCFYRSADIDEPNLLDTYHAVAALALISQPVGHRDALLRFLDATPDFGVSFLFYHAFTLEALGAGDQLGRDRLQSIADIAIGPPDLSTEESISNWLERTRQAVLLKRRYVGAFNAGPTLADIEGILAGDSGKAPNLLDTFMGLDAILALDPGQTVPKVQSFLETQQAPAFGFAFNRYAPMPTLEVLHAGVTCCALLGLHVRYPEPVLRFALACQAADGAFARAPGALPDIEMTHLALEILARLSHEAGITQGWIM